MNYLQVQFKNARYFLALTIRSFELDLQWLNLEPFPQKYLFLWKKYLFLIAWPLSWNTVSKSYKLNIWNRSIFLENRESIGILQSVFIFNSELKNIIPKNGTVIDIGAHTGEFALFCDIYLQAKYIYSFEPITASYKILKQNKKNNIYHTAIGMSRNITMHIPQHTVMASSFSVPDGSLQQEEASCTQLDTIPEIANLTSIDLLKIDVEGMEYEVLEASIQSLKKSRHILIELSVSRPSSQSALHTITYLCSQIPNIALIHIGQIFQEKDLSNAADFLFSNPTPTAI